MNINNNDELDIRIKYIYHSCYTVEIKDKILVFDYYKGELPPPIEGKKYYFFVTHSHADHFNKVIFDYGKMEDNQYILSKDVKELYKDDNIIYLNKDDAMDITTLKAINRKKNIHFMEKDEEYFVDDIQVQAFGSTDKGLSFLISIPISVEEDRYSDFTCYHAGDLNNWIWPEDTQEEREKMHDDFITEVEKIDVEQLDIAFFPVDPRLGENYALGAEEFMDIVEPEILFPMHFGENTEITEKFAEEHKEYYTNIRTIEKQGEEFTLGFSWE